MSQSQSLNQTKFGYWIRNQHGNRSLGSLYSGINDQLLELNVSISYARLLHPEYSIMEQTRMNVNENSTK